MPGYYTKTSDEVRTFIFDSQEAAIKYAKELIAPGSSFQDVTVVESAKFMVSDDRGNGGNQIFDLNASTTEWLVVGIK
ncbi:MAG: hypothetical protein AAF065_14545 [Verrucomicrobiota bacterium]